MILTFILWILCGFICYKIAEKNNRDKIIAVIIGILTGIFGILGYLIISKKDYERKN